MRVWLCRLVTYETTKSALAPRATTSKGVAFTAGADGEAFDDGAVFAREQEAAEAREKEEKARYLSLKINFVRPYMLEICKSHSQIS